MTITLLYPFTVWATNMRYFACDRVIQFLKLVTENLVVMISYGKCINTSICFGLFGALRPLLTEREESDFYWNSYLSGINAIKGRPSWICSSVSLVWHPRPERTCASACHWHTAWYCEPPFSLPPRWMTSSPSQSGSPSWTSAETVHRGMRVTMMWHVLPHTCMCDSSMFHACWDGGL